jgi:uncharacterized membrane protein
VRRRPAWTALLGAVLGYWLSFTPSLLPRPWLLQALAAAVTALIGYALGAFVQWLAGRWVTIDPRFRRWAWWAMAVGGPAAAVYITAWSVRWQGDLRRAVGMDPRLVWWQWALVPVVTLVLAGLLLLLGRSIRLGTRALGRQLGRLRFVSPAVALCAAVVVTAVILAGSLQGFLERGLLASVERSAELSNDLIAPDVPQPQLSTVSGGPGSFEDWSSLGANGRDFVSQTPARARIADFSGHPAMDPVRVYVGLRSAPTLADRARLAVAELERTGAFKRRVLAVMNTTGSGWINENIASPLEYMYGGDTALVAIQYSYLPSWVSFLTEGEASSAGYALFSAVYQHWRSLPADSRPTLLLAGESLGSYATEQSFHGRLDQLTASADGALLVGPTPDNPIHHHVTERRDPGSPAWLPVYQDGRTVRFGQTAADLDRPGGQEWRPPRVAYLQNGTDPVTWWVPDLIWRHPDWLRGRRAPDVSPDMQWYPLLTFWQVTCDLAAADTVPDGHGHRFGQLPVEAWARIAPPPGWTAADSRRLAHLLRGEREEQG